MSIGPKRKHDQQLEEQAQIPSPGRSSGMTRVRKGQPMATYTIANPPSVAAVLPLGKKHACAAWTCEVFGARRSVWTAALEYRTIQIEDCELWKNN